ncbi:MAG: PaaI family thioesterase [Rhizobiaceae bacterium]
MTALANPETKFQPRDPDFVAKVETSFVRQEAMKTLGIHIHEVRAGFVELRMPYTKKYTQQHGFMHAGVLATALDSACGYAAFSLMENDAAVLTVEFKTNLLAPAKGKEFAFRAQVLKSGKTLTVCDAQAFAITNREERLIASMNGTLIAVYGRPDVQQ